jgi:Lon protease-like protein
MSDTIQIPMFPLTLLPLPGELVPLHIFEPRYKQLLEEAESQDLSFGIFFSHDSNAEKIGSLMKLESVIKRYPGGESDIIVRCVDVFSMEVMSRTFKRKPYPGGIVRLWQIGMSGVPGTQLYESFLEFMNHRKISKHVSTFSVFQIANELNMDFAERYAFLLAPEETREKFLVNRIRFLIHLLNQELKSKDVFHLN